MIRAEEALAHMRQLPIVTPESLDSLGPILILAPHPDDESLGCGGLIAETCARRTPPVVVVLTDGSKSHPNSLAFPAERLRTVREDETRAALRELELPPERIVFLRYTDTDVPASGRGLDEAATWLEDLIRRWGCRTVAVSWRHDPHCDHEAAAAIAELACRRAGTRLLAYPVWGLTLEPDTLIDAAPITGFRLDVACHLPAKRAAIEAHRSQYGGIITDDPEGFQMTPGFMDLFLTQTEIFIDVDLSP